MGEQLHSSFISVQDNIRLNFSSPVLNILGLKIISERAPYPRKVSKERSLRPVVAGIIDSVEAVTPNLLGVPSS